MDLLHQYINEIKKVRSLGSLTHLFLFWMHGVTSPVLASKASFGGYLPLFLIFKWIEVLVGTFRESSLTKLHSQVSLVLSSLLACREGKVFYNIVDLA